MTAAVDPHYTSCYQPRMTLLTRRHFLRSLLAAPAIVSASSLMPIRGTRLLAAVAPPVAPPELYAGLRSCEWQGYEICEWQGYRIIELTKTDAQRSKQ